MIEFIFLVIEQFFSLSEKNWLESQKIKSFQLQIKPIQEKKFNYKYI